MYANVAQLVEHDLAKVGVIDGSPVLGFFYGCSSFVKSDIILPGWWNW